MEQIRNEQDMDCVIRNMEKEEYSLLSDFLYEAIFVPDGTEPPSKSYPKLSGIAGIYCGLWNE